MELATIPIVPPEYLKIYENQECQHIFNEVPNKCEDIVEVFEREMGEPKAWRVAKILGEGMQLIAS